jgi:hypothetical protein
LCTIIEDIPESSNTQAQKSPTAALATKKVPVREDGSGGFYTISATLDDK